MSCHICGSNFTEAGGKHKPWWLNTSTSFSVTIWLGILSAGTALMMGYDFLRAVATSGGEVTGVRRCRMPGMSSLMLRESVYFFASSITSLVIAIPLEGPKNRGVSSSSPSLTRPPGRTISSVS